MTLKFDGAAGYDHAHCSGLPRQSLPIPAQTQRYEQTPTVNTE